ncbi:FTSH11 protein [Corchorus olitorius]|uniref:FTSH11 protein n=1 Tax=Corchorus olitorius TaxID=93759 RepID=A0A1R3GSV4_9ROSI|nr:FTSH11 protein [Corchorus olitorius]
MLRWQYRQPLDHSRFNKSAEHVYDKYDDVEEDSDLFGEDSDLFVCEGEQSDFVLDEGFVCEGEQSDFVLDDRFVCEGEDSEFVIDGKRLETVVSKQAVCDFVWMDIGWLFNHDMN